MRPCVIILAAGLWQGHSLSQDFKLPGMETATVRLRPGATNAELRMRLSPYGQGGDILTIETADQSVGISLVSPDGRVITRELARQNGFEWELSNADIWEDFDPMRPFTNAIDHWIKFPPNQPSGIYEIHADSRNFTLGSVLKSAFLNGMIAPEIFPSDEVRVVATHNKLIYAQGDRPLIRIAARDGLRPINSVSVSGLLYKARNHQKVGAGTPLVLVQGDDSYVANLPALPEGDYLVEWSASGRRSNGQAFTKNGSFQFVVDSHTIDIIGLAERDIDADRDGLFEEIDVIVKVRVLIAGQYSIGVLAADDAYVNDKEKAEGGGFSGFLEVGERSVTVKLDGRRLARTGPGPYSLVYADAHPVDTKGRAGVIRNPGLTLSVNRSQLPR
jgi:hypothetical protein